MFVGEVTCEQLDQKRCAFAVSSTGKRCVLEKRIKRSGKEMYTCRASNIEAEKLKDWIESDHCINACGLDRNTLGISSDSLMETCFKQKLCSSPCHHTCPNIVDLYFNLAAGEGVFLPKLCESQNQNVISRRGMSQIRSSGHHEVAPGPLYSANYYSVVSPIQSPTQAPY